MNNVISSPTRSLHNGSDGFGVLVPSGTQARQPDLSVRRSAAHVSAITRKAPAPVQQQFQQTPAYPNNQHLLRSPTPPGYVNAARSGGAGGQDLSNEQWFERLRRLKEE
jgi:hypothetical protein